jgi:hypothetical protein
MLKKLTDKFAVNEDAHVALAWVLIIGYAVKTGAPFYQFWPAVIALLGVHVTHSLFSDKV